MNTYFLCFLVGILLETVMAALPSDATTWTVGNVNEWVDTLDTASGSTIKAAVTKHTITGNILMVLDDSDLQEELGVSSGIERKKIMVAITALKDSDSERYAKLTFWELRALNRQMVDYTTPLLTSAPRWAITNFDDFPKYCQPAAALGEGHNSVLSWLEWALFPEWYIWSNRDTIMCGLPGFIPYVCFLNLAIAVFFILAAGSVAGINGILVAGAWSILVKLLTELGVGITSWLFSAIVWPFVPWFLCDLMFYCFVYVFPLLTLCQTILGGNKQKTN